MGTECFRDGCAAVSISLRRGARRKKMESGGPCATSASHSAASGRLPREPCRAGERAWPASSATQRWAALF
ncbi:hypothetical protein DIE03_03985 [Burkholderia sp. Bp8992]|nr:hypothetical protein DIE03_03985 [Burkholderia sp. Bp8992]